MVLNIYTVIGWFVLKFGADSFFALKMYFFKFYLGDNSGKSPIVSKKVVLNSAEASVCVQTGKCSDHSGNKL